MRCSMEPTQVMRHSLCLATVIDKKAIDSIQRYATYSTYRYVTYIPPMQPIGGLLNKD